MQNEANQQQAALTNTPSHRWLTASQTPAARLVTDPVTEVPALLGIAAQADALRRAEQELTRAITDARSFSVRHSADDPAHADHNQQIDLKRRLVNELRQALDRALGELGQSIDLNRVHAS